MLRLILLPVLLFLLSLYGRGQYFSTGQDPAATKWMQIRTQGYKIIFPEQNSGQAQYLARILDLSIPAETVTLKARMPRIPFLLHTRTTESNGVTTWAPRRIELYTCPPQDIYPEDWLEQLVLHEFRHAVQISKMNQGFTRGLSWFFGEQATGAMLGLFMPTWFLEGDATCTETALSLSGRGRTPAFSATLRAQLLEKGSYPFNKATLGSYKTVLPDPYELGYYLVGAGRVKYGPELWNTAVDRSAKYPFMVVPFASGIKKITGLSKVKYYKSVMHHLDSTWRMEDHSISPTTFRQVTRRNVKNYTEYDHPVHVNDSLFLSAKTSNEEPARLVTVNRRGEEKRITRLGDFQQESHSVSDSWVAWVESRPHIRWQNKNFSEIRYKNLQHGATRNLTRRSRYFSPMLSPSGDRIAAVHLDEQNHSRLDLLSFPEGALLQSFPAPENGLILYPAWSSGGTELTMTLLTAKGKSIVVLTPATGTFRTELPPGRREISGPSFFFRNYLIFTGDYTGIDNLYALDTLTGQVFQVTSARFASGDPDFSSDKEWMIYSDLNSDGLMIVEKKIEPGVWIPVNPDTAAPYRLAEALSSLEKINVQQAALDSGLYLIQERIAGGDSAAARYAAKRYRRGLHLFNPHSWGPLSIDAGNMTVNPGISVVSQNLLSSAFSSAGYTWDLNEQTGKFFLGFRYEGWWPVIDFQATYGKRAGAARYAFSNETFRFTWNETTLGLDLSLPLNLSSGAWIRYVQPMAGIASSYMAHDATTPQNFTLGWVTALSWRLWCANYIRSNYQDVYPQWGQTIDLNYQHSPFGDNDPGSIFSAESNLYFPGILRHHGVMLYGGYQRRWYQRVYGYLYPSMVSYPRGVTNGFDDELLSLSANYKFPFLRADLSIGSVLYIKRFKFNLFYDWAEGFNAGTLTPYSSTGLELTSDLHILRFYAPLELGVRGYFLPLTSTFGFEFLYSVSF